MAKLEKVREIENYLTMSYNTVVALGKESKQGVWSKEQTDQFNQLIDGLWQLHKAVSTLVKNNR